MVIKNVSNAREKTQRNSFVIFLFPFEGRCSVIVAIFGCRIPGEVAG
jgi:hypothetical protein